MKRRLVLRCRSSMKRTFGMSFVIVTVAALAMSHRTEAAERDGKALLRAIDDRIGQPPGR